MQKELVNRCKPLPSGSKLLVLGGGFSGQHVAALARALGTDVLCSRRNLDSPGADLVFDSESNEIPSQQILQECTHLLSCIPPSTNGEDPVLASMKEELKEMPLQWVGYLSTTGVYGDSKGNWVSETDIPKPKQERSKRRLACEKSWEKSGLPLQILRLPGIYGPGRSAINVIRKGKSRMVDKPGQVFSRIHIDDIAGATIHLINLAATGKRPLIINIADDRPSSNIEVMRYAAHLLGSPLPQLESFEEACKEMSPMALSFWQENRRVKNHLLCKDLGYKLLHPDFESGLQNCFSESSSTIKKT